VAGSTFNFFMENQKMPEFANNKGLDS